MLEQDEKDKNDQKEAERRAAEKRMEVKRFQVMQMHGQSIVPQYNNLVSSRDDASVTSPKSASLTQRRVANQPAMTIEELRLNKALLKEIN